MYRGQGENGDLMRLKNLNWDENTLILRTYANCHTACGGDNQIRGHGPKAHTPEKDVQHV